MLYHARRLCLLVLYNKHFYNATLFCDKLLNHQKKLLIFHEQPFTFTPKIQTLHILFYHCI